MAEGRTGMPALLQQEASFLKKRLLWNCRGCKKQYSVKVGTIFEDSAIGWIHVLRDVDARELQERRQLLRSCAGA